MGYLRKLTNVLLERLNLQSDLQCTDRCVVGLYDVKECIYKDLNQVEQISFF